MKPGIVTLTAYAERTMPMNRIQFQPGLSMKEFQEQYGSEAQCEAALVTSRWLHGWVCPRCKGTRYASTYKGRQMWECLERSCRYQCSSIAETVFEQTKLPLRTWFLAIYLMTQSKNAISELAMKRQLGVSYKTAWLVKHKLLQTMWLREEDRRLDERVELDDAYLGGERSGGKVGRGAPGKTPFVAAVQTTDDGRPMFMRLSPVPGFTNEALKAWAANSLMPGAYVVSDGLWCFEGVTHTAANHERHVTGDGRKAAQRPEFRWVNTMLGNLKTAIKGTYHAFDHAKYAHRYLAEFAYRFNRRFDLPAMVPASAACRCHYEAPSATRVKGLGSR